MNASARHFSEERALQHAQKLAGEIGERQVYLPSTGAHPASSTCAATDLYFQVSTPALDTATRYIKDTADQLVEQASQRQDLQVQVPKTRFIKATSPACHSEAFEPATQDHTRCMANVCKSVVHALKLPLVFQSKLHLEHTVLQRALLMFPLLCLQVRQEQVTGGVLMALLGLELANVYQNLTNVILTITPKDCQDVPAVLVNAHFDSAVGSPGLVQVDCAPALHAATSIACRTLLCTS